MISLLFFLGSPIGFGIPLLTLLCDALRVGFVLFALRVFLSVPLGFGFLLLPLLFLDTLGFGLLRRSRVALSTPAFSLGYRRLAGALLGFARSCGFTFETLPFLFLGQPLRFGFLPSFRFLEKSAVLCLRRVYLPARTP